MCTAQPRVLSIVLIYRVFHSHNCFGFEIYVIYLFSYLQQFVVVYVCTYISLHNIFTGYFHTNNIVQPTTLTGMLGIQFFLCIKPFIIIQCIQYSVKRQKHFSPLSLFICTFCMNFPAAKSRLFFCELYVHMANGGKIHTLK